MKTKQKMKTCGTCKFADRCNVPAWSNSTYICTYESNSHHESPWERVKEWFCKCEHWQEKQKVDPMQKTCKI